MAQQFLQLTDISGSPQDCGFAYGHLFAPEIFGFFAQEIEPSSSRLKYARNCWQCIEKDAAVSAAFIRGMSEATTIDTEHLTLLLLHEELVQQSQFAVPHCTAFAIRRNVMTDYTIVAQNWDWEPSSYPWPGLLKMRMRGSAATLTYHYPGLWSACGINEHGLSLMWTGGYNIPVKIAIGIPTYVLIAEILQLHTVNEAIKYINAVNTAGAFIFLLGDAMGDTCVIEATPESRITQKSTSPLCRANHFVYCLGKKCEGWESTMNIQESVKLYDGLKKTLKQTSTMTIRKAKNILTRPPLFHKTDESKTIDSLIAVCEYRALWTRRGGNKPGHWQKVYI